MDTLQFGEGFHRFYDPNASFRGDDIGLLDWMDRRRAARVSVDTPSGVEPLGPREQIAVELGHCMLLTEDNLAQWTGLELSDETLKDAVGVAEFGAKQAVASVLRAVDWLRDTHGEIRERADEVDTRGILLAGAISAAAAHRGQKRLNANPTQKPYYTHVADVASILSIAWRNTESLDTQTDDLPLRLLQYRGLNHDGFEDSMSSSKQDRGKSFLLAKNLLTSPLFHERLLQARLADVDGCEELAQEVARDIFFMTKPVGRNGRMHYPPYIIQLTSRPWAAVGKLADIRHNRDIDPKEVTPEEQPKVDKQQAQYKRAQERLLRSLRLRTTQPELYELGLAIQEVGRNNLSSQRSYRLLKQLDYDTALDAYDHALLAA